MKRPLHKIGIPTLFVCIVLFSFCMKPINVSADYETPGNFSTTFPQSQKLFHVEGGSLLLSTDGANYTKAALLSDPENPQSALWVLQFSFVYTDAIAGDSFLYLLEESNSSGTRIGWLDTEKQAFYTYTAAIHPILPLQWKICDDNGLSLRAVRLSDPTPGTFYIRMQDNPYETDFEADTTPSESTPPSSDKPEEEVPVTKIYHTFPEGTTVSSLEKEYSGSSRILVSDASGIQQTGGNLHTGWTIRLYDGTRLTSIVTIRIPGDIGGQTDSGNRNLYFRYLAGETELSEPYRTAADLNHDGSITVGDRVLFRKAHG